MLHEFDLSKPRLLAKTFARVISPSLVETFFAGMNAFHLSVVTTSSTANQNLVGKQYHANITHLPAYVSTIAIVT